MTSVNHVGKPAFQLMLDEGYLPDDEAPPLGAEAEESKPVIDDVQEAAEGEPDAAPAEIVVVPPTAKPAKPVKPSHNANGITSDEVKARTAAATKPGPVKTIKPPTTPRAPKPAAEESNTMATKTATKPKTTAKPVAKKPAVKKPAAKKPVAKKPATKKPAGDGFKASPDDKCTKCKTALKDRVVGERCKAGGYHSYSPAK